MAAGIYPYVIHVLGERQKWIFIGWVFLIRETGDEKAFDHTV